MGSSEANISDGVHSITNLALKVLLGDIKNIY